MEVSRFQLDRIEEAVNFFLTAAFPGRNIGFGIHYETTGYSHRGVFAAAKGQEVVMLSAQADLMFARGDVYKSAALFLPDEIIAQLHLIYG